MKPSADSPAASADPRMTVGTLTYTKAGLFGVFSWLLWASLCFQLFENSGGPEDTLGLYLQHNYHVSNVQINVLFNLIPQLMGVIMTPIISFKSDRTRSRWGRRIPYIAFAVPFLCAFSVLVGFSDDFLRFFKATLGPESWISPFTAAMVVIGALTVGFTFFNEFVGTVYWYLFADVVPRAFLGRYMALFRTVGVAAGLITNLLIRPYQLTHLKAVHSGVALLYFIGFGLLCWRVKEGEYPPVIDVTRNTPVWQQGRIYFRECFTHRVYVLFYLVTATTMLARGLLPAGVFGLHLGQHRGNRAAHPPGETHLAAAALSGDWYSGGADGQVLRWPAPAALSEALPEQVSPGGAPVAALAASPDGGHVAVARKAGGVEILDGRGARLATLPEPDGGFRSLAFSPDGLFLAAAAGDGRVLLVAIPGDDPVVLAGAHDAPVGAVAFSEEGLRLVSVDARGTVALWDAASGQPIWRVESVATALGAVCFLPEMEAAVPSVAGRTAFPVRAWRLIRGYLRDVFSNESYYDVAPASLRRIVRADGWIAVGGADGADASQDAAVRILDANDGQVVASMRGHKEAVTALAYKRELRILVSGSRDGSVRVWDPLVRGVLANDESIKAISGYVGAVSGLVLADEGPELATCDETGEVHAWDLDEGVSLRKSGVSGTFVSILGLALAYPFGALVDRRHPLRIMIAMQALILPMPFLSFWLTHDYLSGFWINLVRLPFGSLLAAAGIPLMVVLFPKTQYGQMSSANALVRQLVAAIAGILGAILMDVMTRNALLTDNFRYGFLFQGVAGVLTFLALLLLHREWRRLGGTAGYVPPETTP